jgi:hypothetical protein
VMKIHLKHGEEYIIHTNNSYGTRTGTYDIANNCIWLTDCVHPLQNRFMPISEIKIAIPFISTHADTTESSHR